MQGGIHPDLPGIVLPRPPRRREGAACPTIHIHAFSPMEIMNGATRMGVSFA